MGSIGSENQDSAGPGGEDVALLVDLQAIGQAGTPFFEPGCRIEEDLAVGDRAIVLYVVDHPDGLIGIRARHVELLLIGREADAVGAGYVLCQEDRRGGALGQTIHSLEGQLLGRVIHALFEAVGGVGEIEVAVGVVDRIVGAVEAFAIVVGCQRLEAPVFSQPGNPPVAVLAEDQVAGRVEEQPVGAGLAAAGGCSGIAGRAQVDAEPLTVFPAHNPVVGNVGEEHRALLRQPHRPLTPGEAAGQLFDGRALGNNLIEARIETNDFPHTGAFRGVLAAAYTRGGAEVEVDVFDAFTAEGEKQEGREDDARTDGTWSCIFHSPTTIV